jgi:MSHA biogenesis protein MshG
MVHVGENTGRLDDSFLQISKYLELEHETRRRIRATLRYPTFVIGTITLALVILNLFVIPAFAKIFKSFKAELPWATELLIAISNFFVNYWPHMLIGLCIAAWAVRRYLSTPAGRGMWHYWQLKIPTIGTILLHNLLARFARSFSVMFRAGVSLVQVLHIVSEAVGNDYVAKQIQKIREQIEKGELITPSAASTHLFTPLVLQMISVGEETGSLDAMLLQVAEFYEREVDYALKKLNEIVEPVLIGMLGVMVLVLALGVFLPIWSLATTLH